MLCVVKIFRVRVRYYVWCRHNKRLASSFFFVFAVRARGRVVSAGSLCIYCIKSGDLRLLIVQAKVRNGCKVKHSNLAVVLFFVCFFINCGPRLCCTSASKQAKMRGKEEG